MQSVFNISVSLTRRGESRAGLVHTDDADMHTNLVRIAGFIRIQIRCIPHPSIRTKSIGTPHFFLCHAPHHHIWAMQLETRFHASDMLTDGVYSGLDLCKPLILIVDSATCFNWSHMQKCANCSLRIVCSRQGESQDLCSTPTSSKDLGHPTGEQHTLPEEHAPVS